MPLLPKGTILWELQILEVFIEYDYPRLFSVVNNLWDVFIVLNIEEEDDGDTWLYLKLDHLKLKLVRWWVIPLRELFLNHSQDLLYKVQTETNAESIIIEKIDINDISTDLLPNETTCLKLDTPTQENIDYYEELNKSNWLTSWSMMLSFDTEEHRTSVIELWDLWMLLTASNNAWMSMIKDQQQKTNDPLPIKRYSLFVEKTVAWSFALKLSNYSGSLFSNTFEESIKRFTAFFDYSKIDLINDNINKLYDEWVIKKIKSLLLSLKRRKYSLWINWVDEKKVLNKISLTPSQSMSIYNKIQEFVGEEDIETDIIDCLWKLRWIHLDRKTFKFVSMDWIPYEGNISDDAIDDPYIINAKIGKTYLWQILIEKRKHKKEEDINYTLIWISDEKKQHSEDNAEE